MSEYIIPERIYDRKYWWMINMRLRYLSKKAPGCKNQDYYTLERGNNRSSTNKAI